MGPGGGFQRGQIAHCHHRIQGLRGGRAYKATVVTINPRRNTVPAKATPSRNALGYGYTLVHATAALSAESRNSGECHGSTCVPARPWMTPPKPVQARGQVGDKKEASVLWEPQGGGRDEMERSGV